jgi:glycosyltransferase involved in cell wall biosynthesis
MSNVLPPSRAFDEFAIPRLERPFPLTIMKPLVLFNHRSQVADRPTGITRYAFSLLEALILRDNFRFGLVTTWSEASLPATLRNGLVRIETVSKPRPYSWNIVRQVFENWGQEFGADIILNTDQIGLIRGGRARVFIAHDLYFRAMPRLLGLTDRLQQRYFIWPLMMMRHQRIGCASENTKNDLQRYFPSRGWKAQVIGAGGDLSSKLISRHPLIATLESPYILYVGNVLPNKNIETLTEAMELLAQRGRKLRVIHVGRDDQGLLANAAAKMRLALPPLTLSSVSDAELVGLYAEALCFANTSIYEGFCLPVVEAQHAGTPVVCSRAPAVGETAGAGALLFDPLKPGELASRIEELIDQPQLRSRLLELGRKNAERHRWSRTAERLESIFLELLGAGGEVARSGNGITDRLAAGPLTKH